MKKHLYPAALLATLAGLGTTSDAQTGAAGAAAQYPSRAIRMIVPFPPGGSDTVARLVARRMSESLGQQIVVDNRPGAAGVIGTHLAAQASPDGYTLVFITASLTITPATARLPYDLTRDFVAIAPVATGPLVLVVHPSVPAKSVSELVALSKAKPNSLNYASSGSGSITHLAAELFKSLTTADLTHVPFKGTGPAQNELLAGRVQAMFGVLAPALPHVQAEAPRARRHERCALQARSKCADRFRSRRQRIRGGHVVRHPWPGTHARSGSAGRGQASRNGRSRSRVVRKTQRDGFRAAGPDAARAVWPVRRVRDREMVEDHQAGGDRASAVAAHLEC